MVSKHPGSQPPPEISHYDCAGVNFTQKNRQRGAHWMGTLRAQIYGGAQVVCLELFVVCAESKPLLKVAFAFLCLKEDPGAGGHLISQTVLERGL